MTSGDKRGEAVAAAPAAGRSLPIGKLPVLRLVVAFALLSVSLTGCGTSKVVHVEDRTIDPQTGWKGAESSRLSRNHGAVNLVDPTSRFAWTTDQRPFFPEWVELAAPQPITVGEFSMTGVSWRPQTMPRKFDLEIWNGGAWAKALSVDNACITDKEPSWNWTLPREVSGQMFRILIHSNCGDNIHVIIKSVQFEPRRPIAAEGPLFLKESDRVFPQRKTLLTASSELPSGRHTAQNLSDGDIATFWHVDPKSAGRQEILIDFGYPRKVNVVRAKPRSDLPGQIFEVAYLQVSRNGSAWRDVAQLRLGRADTADWRTWHFANPHAERFLRLVFARGQRGGPFMSLAELELYEQDSIRPMIPVQSRPEEPTGLVQLLGAQQKLHLTANTVLRAEFGTDRLIDGERGTFWHVAENVTGTAMLSADFGEPGIQLQMIRALPRPDQPTQFFRSAVVAGSLDNAIWDELAVLEQTAVPQAGQWLSWRVPETARYRFFRIAFQSGHADGRFLSLAELEFWGKADVSKSHISALPAAKAISARQAKGRQLFGSSSGADNVVATSQLRPELGPHAVSDGNPATFWHVAMSAEAAAVPAVLTIDLGTVRDIVRFLKVTPRPGNEIQFFRDVLVQGSNDGTIWSDIAMIRQDEIPAAGKPLAWAMPELKAVHRYLRFVFNTGHAGGRFLSLSELELLGPEP